MNPEQRLLEGALQGNVQKVRQALAQGADPHTRSSSYRLTPLHNAVRRSDRINQRKEIIRLLHQHGADLESKDDKGFTPIFHAQLSRSPELTETLLQMGADFNVGVRMTEPMRNKVKSYQLLKSRRSLNRTQSSKGLPQQGAGGGGGPVEQQQQIIQGDLDRLLLQGIRDLNQTKIKQALARGADPNVIDPASGQTPIIQLVYLLGVSQNKPKIFKILELLIKNGADVNKEDSENNPPLWHAGLYKIEPAMFYLFSKGADIDRIRNKNQFIQRVLNTNKQKYQKLRQSQPVIDFILHGMSYDLATALWETMSK